MEVVRLRCPATLSFSPITRIKGYTSKLSMAKVSYHVIILHCFDRLFGGLNLGILYSLASILFVLFGKYHDGFQFEKERHESDLGLFLC
ncbi:hypothetical protein LINPERPRIM_LOCUS15222 [Linum perenne]